MKVNKFLFIFLIICWEIVGREAGPTVSVSQSTIYITGTSEDNLSGTAIYRYDPPNNQGELKNVDNITTETFTAPQFELTTSGIWKFTGIDQAGNSDSAETEDITLYLCNYCNQKTVQLHYNCPTHFNSRSCTTWSTTCDEVDSVYCGKTPALTGQLLGGHTVGEWTCHVCGLKILNNFYHYFRNVVCQEHLYYQYTLSKNAVVCTADNKARASSSCRSPRLSRSVLL